MKANCPCFKKGGKRESEKHKYFCSASFHLILNISIDKWLKYFPYKRLKYLPFRIEYFLWTWLTTAKLNCEYLLQPYGNVAESATSKYIDRWSTLFPFGKTNIRLMKPTNSNQLLATALNGPNYNLANENEIKNVPFISANWKRIRIILFHV